jgi:hypothetical protein
MEQKFKIYPYKWKLLNMKTEMKKDLIENILTI